MSAAPEPQPFLHRRPDLAKQIASQLDGDGVFAPTASVFLTAPRRTGKSTFLRQDLVPELENRNILPIYVDLWSNRAEDPGRLISEAIKKAMRAADGLPTKLARQAGLTKLGGSYLSIDIEKIGAQEGVTLAAALEALLDRTGKRICLIVDEAQHALTSENGVNAMFALKAARDALNMRDDARTGPNLLLVFTGSQRDKLASLVTRKEQPFFGSQVLPFPLLDRAFTDAYATWVNARLDPAKRFRADDIHEAFHLLGRRPEFLRDALQKIVFGGDEPGDLGRLLQDNARDMRASIWAEHESAWNALTPIQQSVLAHLIEQGDAFAPFSRTSLDAYARTLKSDVTVPTVQSALAALREKGIVWQSARGTYALEEADMKDWLREQVARLMEVAAAEAIVTMRRPGGMF